MSIITRRSISSSTSSTGLGPFINTSFDNGSLVSHIVLETTTPTIRLTPKKHWSNNWAWYCIQTRHLKGKTPHFLISKANHYSMISGEKLACWAQSADTDSWNDFDNIIVGETDLEFYNNQPFPNGPIYISALPMYPFKRVKRKVTEWLDNPLVSDTSSSTNGIIGYSTVRDAGDGSTKIVPALPYYGFKISSGSGTKNKIVLTAGNHPSEIQGLFQLEGCVEWLLGGSELANYCLSFNDFYVYPCINPQGVWSGYFRSCPQAPTIDHNRIWNTTGTYEDVDIIKNAITNDTGGTIEVGMDYHGWMSTWKHRGYTSEDQDTLHIAFKNLMVKFEPEFLNVLSDTETMLQVVFKSDYQARLHYNMEFGTSITHQITDYKKAGEYSGKTLAYMCAEGWLTESESVGSRDFNGTSDRIDWNPIADLTNSPMTLSMWVNIDAYPSPSNNGYLFCIHNTENNNFAIALTHSMSGESRYVSFLIGRSTNYLNRYTNIQLINQGWRHILFTYSGEPIDGSTFAYLNGVLNTSGGFTEGSGTITQATGSWSVGARIYDDNRCTDGKIAQVGVWNRVLNTTEIANLGAGYAPDKAAENGLLFYFKGNTPSLYNSAPEGAEGVSDGTTHVTGPGNGPGIFYN